MPFTSRKPKIVFLGAGKLGSLLIQSWIKHKTFKAQDVHIHVKSKKSSQKLKKIFPQSTITCSEENSSIPPALFYVIAVKPSQWIEIKKELQSHSPSKAFFVSIMAGIKASQLEKDLKKPVIVAMTNTSLQVNKALTSLFRSPLASQAQERKVQKLFKVVGSVYVLPESLFAKATAWGGSHPAFIIWIIQSLSELLAKDLKIKNTRDWSQNWIVEIFEGVLALLKTQQSAETLLKQITTPGGCTEVGIKSLEELKIKESLGKVFKKCSNKAQQLGKK